MSDQYLVTARKYRPGLFKELVAQDHVAQTLKNALRDERLAHAYLFSGPRGVGKTTTARILAKAINCETPKSEREDGAEPCRQCPSCQSFEEGRNLNIIEFDAASNNKVDDIRELREKVRVPPQGGNKKVYIIDEVHMLSTQAFNALLKTLEEPPEHVLFIFATTEPNKVLPTILSRCQRFDFHRIPVQEIVEQLRAICEEEDIEADEESLMLLARKGNGALRDALSAFDQAVSLCGTTLRYGELAQALGVVDRDLYFRTTQYVAEGNTAGMLQLVDKVVQAGYDLQEFLSGLAEHLRNLLVACTMEDPSLIEATDELRTRFTEHAEAFSEPDLLRLLTIVGETQDTIREHAQPRLQLEMALLKMTNLARAADLRTVIEKVKRLEQQAEEGQLADLNNAGSEEPPASQEPTSESNAALDEREETPPPEAAYDEPSSSPAVGEPDPPAEPNIEDATEETDDSADFSPPDTPPKSSPDASPSPSESEKADTETTRERYQDLFNPPALNTEKGKDTPNDADTPPSNNPQAHHGGDGTSTATAPVAAPSSDKLARIETAWPQLVKAVKQERIHVGALLQHSEPTDVRGQTLSVAVPDDFHQRLLRSQQVFLIKHVQTTLTEELEQLDFFIQPGLDTTDQRETADEVNPYEYMKQKRQENPVVNAIFEKFGGELVW